MPDYYSGPNVANSLSQGLMAGYQFVDNIYQRKLDNQDRAHARQLQDRAANLADSADLRAQHEDVRRGNEDTRAASAETRAQAAFDVAKEDHARELHRQNDQDFAHAMAAASVANGGLNKVPDAQKRSLIDTARAANKELATHTDDEVWGHLQDNMNMFDLNGAQNEDKIRRLAENTNDLASLQADIQARAGAADRLTNKAPAPVAPSPGSPTPTAPAPESPSALSRVPSDVVTKYQINTAPGPTSYNPYGTVTGPVSVAAVAPESKGFGSGGPGLFTKATDTRKPEARVREEPLAYADAYLKGRDAFEPGLRPELDAKVTTALQSDIEATRPAYEAAKAAVDAAPTFAAKEKASKELATLGRRWTERQSQLDKAATISAEHAIETAAPRGAVPGEKAAAAVSAAVAAQQQAGVPVPTSGEIRALSTYLDRLTSAPAPAKRFTPAQLARNARLEAAGFISAEQNANLSRYGRLDKPEKPTIQALNSNYGAMITEHGITVFEVPGGKGKTAETAAHELAVLKDNTGEITRILQSVYGNGKSDSQDVLKHSAAFYQMINRDGPEIQKKTGINFMDPATGKPDLSRVSITELPDLVQGYVKWDKGEANPWIYASGKPTASYFPQGGTPGKMPGVVDFSSLK